MPGMWITVSLLLGGFMDNTMNRIKSEFMEVVLRRDGQLNKEQIDFINEYAEFVAQKLEEMNDNH
jgi:hypothetical protein